MPHSKEHSLQQSKHNLAEGSTTASKEVALEQEGGVREVNGAREAKEARSEQLQLASEQSQNQAQVQAHAQTKEQVQVQFQVTEQTQASEPIKSQTQLRKERTFMEKLMHFMRLNVLGMSILSGIVVYFIFHYVSFLAPIKYPLKHTVDTLIPYSICMMLFIAFCKVSILRMRIRRWHIIAMGIQFGLSFLIALVVREKFLPVVEIELVGAIACILSPTASAVPVITGKLGGDESSITSYLILSNLGAAIAIPLIFPLISEAAAQTSFWSEFLTISSKVFPMIAGPFMAAQLVRWFLKPVHHFVITKFKDVAFYLWAVTLSCISATAVSNIVNSPESVGTLVNLAIVGLITTLCLFLTGKAFGHLEGQRISAGQGLGQKNMVIGIWAANSYLSPAAAIAPGCYILWQNMFNSWQLWYRDYKQLTYTDKIS